MRKVGSRTALVAAWVTVLSLAVAGESAAQQRDFAGVVQQISAVEIRVGNRKGDTVSFVRTKQTVVQGAKKSWGAIEKGDRVSVSWKMMDSPRVAYRVVVMPPKEKADR